jgi:AcrR family transcriptional regulator
MSPEDPPVSSPAEPADEHARKHAEALRRDREKAARAAAKELARAERDRDRARRDAEKAQRDRDKAVRAAAKEESRLRAEQDRAVREVEREADRAEREAQKAALDAVLAAQRAARQVERARLRALAAEEPAPDADDAAPDLPPGLALLWRPAPVGRRGPRPGLTLAGIAEAAIALADEDGLAGVSMARVAERVGVTTMALYRYVSSKDDLLALMMETALAEAVAAAEAARADEAEEPGWRPALERWCHDQLGLASAHPWTVESAVAAALPGPARIAFIDRGLRALDGTPLTWPEKTAVVGRLSLHLLSEGQVIAAEVRATRAAEAADGAAPHPALVDYAGLLRAVTDPARHPVLAEALAAGAFDPEPPGAEPAEEHDWGLRLMLDGVEALVERARQRATADAGPGA